MQLDALDTDLKKVEERRLPPYQKDMHRSRLLKRWVMSISMKGINVKPMLQESKVNEKSTIAVNLLAVLDISKLSKGFKPTDLDNIFDAVIHFSSRITEKPEENPDEMEFGDYAVDQFSNDPEVMFWRNLDGMIQRSAGDIPTLVDIIIQSLSSANQRKLRVNYQQDIDLMLGCRGRITPRIQRLVINIIDIFLTHPESLLKTHLRDRDPFYDGSGTMDNVSGEGLVF